MSRKVQIRVDLPQEEYEAVKMAAGSADNIPAYIRKALTESIEKWLRSLDQSNTKSEK